MVKPSDSRESYRVVYRTKDGCGHSTVTSGANEEEALKNVRLDCFDFMNQRVDMKTVRLFTLMPHEVVRERAIALARRHELWFYIANGYLTEHECGWKGEEREATEHEQKLWEALERAGTGSPSEEK